MNKGADRQWFAGRTGELREATGLQNAGGYGKLLQVSGCKPPMVAVGLQFAGDVVEPMVRLLHVCHAFK